MGVAAFMIYLVPYIERLIDRSEPPPFASSWHYLHYRCFGLRLSFPDFAAAANVSNVTQHLQSFFVGWLLGYRLMTGKTQGGALRTSILMSAFAVLA